MKMIDDCYAMLHYTNFDSTKTKQYMTIVKYIKKISRFFSTKIFIFQRVVTSRKSVFATRNRCFNPRKINFR